MDNIESRLFKRQIQPTKQRIAIARYVLNTRDHPTADQVWERVKETLPGISRATVYNTLNVLVEKGLLMDRVIRHGVVVYDPKMESHHHFIDESSGLIEDIPSEAIRVSGLDELEGIEVTELQVIIRSRRLRSSADEGQRRNDAHPTASNHAD